MLEVADILLQGRGMLMLPRWMPIQRSKSVRCNSQLTHLLSEDFKEGQGWTQSILMPVLRPSISVRHHSSCHVVSLQKLLLCRTLSALCGWLLDITV